MKRAVLLAVSCLVLLLSLLSWGVQAEKVKLRHLTNVADPSGIKLYEELAKSFEASHPNIEVEILVPSGPWLDTLMVLMAGGTPPDTVFTASWWIPELVSKGLLLNVEPYAANDKTWDEKAFFPVTIAQTLYKGGRYGVPRHFSPMLMYFNRDAFQSSGLPDPKPTWTWKEMRSTAFRLTKQSGDTVERWGFNNLRGNDLRANAFLIPIVRSFGGDVFSPDGRSLALASPVSAAAVQWIMDLTLKDRVAPPIGVDFGTGKVAMMLFTFDEIMYLRRANVTFDWDLAQVPTGVAGRVNRAATGVHAVVSTSPHPKEAWEWIKFLGEPEAQEAFASSGVAMGARMDKAIVRTLMRDDMPPTNLRLFLEAPLDAQPYPMIPAYNQAVAAILPALDVAWRGEKPFSVAIGEVRKAVELILRQ